MGAEARLDSAVFQLTPTRTRCDLVIIANGKTEKIASGLLNPFVSHLKTAQDQISKGGYSIKLEPDPESEAPWFTKGTVERFVRFVSTPEVLERVHTIESEILQIEKAISGQENDNLGLKTVEDPLTSFRSSAGNIQMHGADAEKAIVPYKTGNLSKPSVSNESKLREESSKVQLVRVLENRKKVLQKEQAMAFACAAAAGFEMESMAHLLSFAESFGASRLREACSQYMQLWVEKHESGQWIEMEGAEALSYRSEFPPLNAAGIIFSEDARKQKEFIEAWPSSAGDVSMEKNNGNVTSLENERDESLLSEPQVPHGQPVYEGQFPYPPFPQWPSHSQANPYSLQPYPMQAMPYYQNYPAETQFLHPPYSPMEESKLNTHQSKGKKQYSMHSKDGSFHSQDSTDQNTSEFDEEPLRVRRSHRKSGHFGKKMGVVVIRNLNYIAKRRQSTSESKSECSSDSDIDYIKGMLSGSVKREDNNQESTEFSNIDGKEEELHKQEDAGNWQAFQSFLMEAEEKMRSAADGNIFAGEKEHSVKEWQNKDGPDPILLSTRDSGNYQEKSAMEYDAFCGEGSRTKLKVCTDEFLVAAEGQVRLNGLADAQFKEMDDGVGEYRKVSSDDFIMCGLEKLLPNKVSSDTLLDFENESGTKLEKSFSPIVADESFVVPFRSGTLDQLGVDPRIAIDMAAEFQSAPPKEEESSSKAMTRVNCEPDDLTLILEHRRESDSVGYNQIVDFDIQVPLFVKQEIKKEEDDVLESINDCFVKTDEVKLNSPQNELEKKRKDPTSLRRVTSIRSTPLSEAQKRAEKLRNYKYDLQKLKKEHEEQEIRRLEALKRERQKRIASRKGSKAVQSSSNPQQFNPEKTSKFKASGNGSSLPPQKLPTPNVSNKGVKTTGSNKSLSEVKESEKQERNSISTRIRRLSEPTGRGVHNVPAKSANTNRAIKMALAETKKITADRTSTEIPHNATIDAVGVAASCASSSPVGTVDRENEAEANQTDPINSFENVSDLRSSHQIYETREKPQNQMGPRKLWKFGRNGHSSHVDDGNLHSYESAARDGTVVAPNGISRPFSTISPFHGRSNEKKVVASA